MSGAVSASAAGYEAIQIQHMHLRSAASAQHISSAMRIAEPQGGLGRAWDVVWPGCTYSVLYEMAVQLNKSVVAVAADAQLQA